MTSTMLFMQGIADILAEIETYVLYKLTRGPQHNICIRNFPMLMQWKDLLGN